MAPENAASICMKRWTSTGRLHLHLCGKNESHGPVHVCSCGAVWRAEK